ncbi:hypothetical protein [Winogradskyella sp.]|uniref:hypothetical protein n=1 Tax=Winogradskyella sp. TaxID=1883156 RepID=UPI00261C132C|nr:hypothetical protein [Winogradskyella sp.]
MEEKLESVIKDYEDDKISTDFALQKIHKISHKRISAYELDNYWKSKSLEDFIKQLAFKPIEDWALIEDNQAIHMINVILKNLDRDELIAEYGEALEKRYRKPSGTLSDLIFYDDLNNAELILKKLKTDTSTRL